VASRHLGIDVGATNLKWCVVEHDGGAWRTVGRDQRPTLPSEGPDAVIGRLVEIARAAVGGWPDVTSIGIGVPGLYDPASGVTRFLVNLPGGWKGVAVGPGVAAATGLPTALINDARAFGLAELRLGAGRGASSMVGLTLGTGVGGVIAIDGRVHQGHDGTAGEVGHQTIDPDGPWCNCGNRGCLEAYARADQIAAACGTPSAEAAIAAARAGDRRAIDGLAGVGRYLGIGIANLITLLAPDRIVIGGGNAAAGDLLFEPLRAELRRRVLMTQLDRVVLTTAELGTWAGAIGAAVHGAERAAEGAEAAEGLDGALESPVPARP
jgi:glucokinase